MPLWSQGLQSVSNEINTIFRTPVTIVKFGLSPKPNHKTKLSSYKDQIHTLVWWTFTNRSFDVTFVKKDHESQNYFSRGGREGVLSTTTLKNRGKKVFYPSQRQCLCIRCCCQSLKLFYDPFDGQFENIRKNTCTLTLNPFAFYFGEANIFEINKF